MIAKCYLIEPFICNVKDIISDVTKKLLEKNQRHIFVVDENEMPVGIISTSDILKKIVSENKSAEGITAKDIMNSDILIFDDDYDAKKAYKDMSKKGFVSSVVTQKNKIIGILTLKETIRFITDPNNID